MVASPIALNTGQSRNAVRLAVLLGDTSGNFPTSLSDFVPWLIPLEIERTSGGRKPNTIKLEIDSGNGGVRWQDVGIFAGSNRIIEVRDATDPTILAAWGKLESDGANVGRGETLTINAPIPWYLIGGVLERVPYHDGVNTTTVNLQEDMVFNPEIKGRLHGNRSTIQDSDGAYLFAHRDSLTTAPAIIAQNQSARLWTLAQAIHRLLWTLNPNEDYLTNPSLAQLQGELSDSARDTMLINYRVPAGTKLTDALDKILKPHGYTWFLDWSGAVGSTTTQLHVMKLGQGLTRTLPVQRLSATIDSRQTEPETVATVFDIGVHPNVYVGQSAIERREITVELLPAWDTSEDSTSWEDLHSNSDYLSNGSKRHVGRKWVWDTAGDYIGLRPEFTVPQTIDGESGLLPRRRRFFPMLTLEAESGAPLGENGYDLQYQDYELGDLEADFGFSVLEDECGIWLDEILPSLWFSFQQNPNDYRLKLTATIELDTGFRHEASRRNQSVNGADVPQLLDLSHRFRKATVQSSGSNKSRFYDDRHFTLSSVTAGSGGSAQLVASADVSSVLKAGQRLTVINDSLFEGVYTAVSVSTATVTVAETITASGTPTGKISVNTDAEDCQKRMQDYVAEVQSDQDYARVTVRTTLSGIDHPQYGIGNLLTGAWPRNVTFNGHAGNNSRYPQVMGIEFRCQMPQRTVLKLEQQPHDR